MTTPYARSKEPFIVDLQRADVGPRNAHHSFDDVFKQSSKASLTEVSEEGRFLVGLRIPSAEAMREHQGSRMSFQSLRRMLVAQALSSSATRE